MIVKYRDLRGMFSRSKLTFDDFYITSEYRLGVCDKQEIITEGIIFQNDDLCIRRSLKDGSIEIASTCGSLSIVESGLFLFLNDTMLFSCKDSMHFNLECMEKTNKGYAFGFGIDCDEKFGIMTDKNLSIATIYIEPNSTLNIGYSFSSLVKTYKNDLTNVFYNMSYRSYKDFLRGSPSNAVLDPKDLSLEIHSACDLDILRENGFIISDTIELKHFVINDMTYDKIDGHIHKFNDLVVEIDYLGDVIVDNKFLLKVSSFVADSSLVGVLPFEDMYMLMLVSDSHDVRIVLFIDAESTSLRYFLINDAEMDRIASEFQSLYNKSRLLLGIGV